mgnify:FL=1
MPAGWLRLSQPGSTGSTARGGRQKCKFHHPHPWAVQVSINSWSQERTVIFPSGNTEASVRNKPMPCYRLPLPHDCEPLSDIYPCSIAERSREHSHQNRLSICNCGYSVGCMQPHFPSQKQLQLGFPVTNQYEG